MKQLFCTKYREDIGEAESSHILNLRIVPPLIALAFLILLAMPVELYAADADNCLMCHRYRGLARVDKEGDYRLFYVDEELFSQGPHARVTCRGCHVDIDKIPHDNAKEVDCLRSCHIEEPTREIIFTHEKVSKTLDDSVHSLVNQDGTDRDFPEDIPGCKDCHDIPLFRPLAMFKSVRSGVSERAISRCLVCHQDESFIRYYYSHVTTRLHKARDPREVVEMCATCHGDAEFAKRHDLPDVVSSYLETYHGKAVLLGSSKAPDCLDCHAMEGSVHEMHGKSDDRSPIHAENRSKTCNVEDCHSTAGPGLSSFDVHASRDMKTHTLEFAVALGFVIMTLAILMPVLGLKLLGYLREVFPSHEAEAEIERLTLLAEKKAVREGGIMRFNGSLRFQHAFLVFTFVILCLTGLPMKFAQLKWSPVILDCFGGIEWAPVVHRIAGIAMLVAFIIHVLGILIKLKVSLNKEGKTGLWTFIKEVLILPMIPGKKDLQDIIATTKYVFFLSPKRPNYGRYSWGEKLEYLGLFWGITLLAVTGTLLWGESIFSRFLPGWVFNIAYLAHTYESILAIAHIMLVHIPGVIGIPGLSLVSGMVLNGKISPKAQAEEHGDEVDSWDSQEEVQS